MKSGYGFVKEKLKESKSRISLTLLFVGAVFAILLAVLLVVSGIAFVMVNVGILSKIDLGIVNGNNIVFLMMIVSVVLGVAFSFAFGRIFMKPINIIINMMNRLAGGDFKSRIAYDGILARYPIVAELTNSINTMAEELENTEMLRSDFVNNFSHEFKTPIVSIAGFAKLLKTPNLTEAQKKEYISIIEEESVRLSDMATNVMSLTKVENQTILSDVSSFNLSEQIRTCFLVLENKWTDKNLDFRFEFDEYTISANEELLRQVWINLLDNAIKFTPYGGTVSVEIRKVEGFLEVSVINTGSTVRDEDKERIFRKFYQADASHSTQGNGIGLAVVSRIVMLHNGYVSVESENDVTRFIVALPENF
ncbi:MAG: HAMP domain-containing sensor histidine kinase [Firmicutes bacterium]|nr:HAMP domain-containing sensor histidine kinase [Bacillota bacterium]